ncbi:uncharacterized protein LOC129765762 [Toxorhynchites rutilus septentrionalis]|uniref:uncharacterized protein LOC129765762 n=1 Tax=Toxorhynchites rutilus septentrionalis TaxID=329112 RepID=UPI00247A96C9|nr:uncharacterized protein LOC129765762 [Toxorhynchites rutilus septentrionalis]
MQKRVIGWWPIDPIMCRLRIKGRFFNSSIINVHGPHLASPDDDKGDFYAQLEREFERCPKHDIKIIIGDFNAKIGKEEEFKPTVGIFLDITDVRTYRGGNIDSDRYLVMVKMRPKLSVVNNIRYRCRQRYDLTRLKQANVAENYAHSLEAALPEEDQINETALEDCWSMIKTTINSVAENILGHVVRRRRYEWFDDEYQQVLHEKNTAREIMVRQATYQNMERYR